MRVCIAGFDQPLGWTMIDSLRSRSRKAGWVNIHIGRGGATLINCSGGRSSTNCDAVGRPSSRSSLLRDPDAKFLWEISDNGRKRGPSQSQASGLNRSPGYLAGSPILVGFAFAADPRSILELGFLCRRPEDRPILPGCRVALWRNRRSHFQGWVFALPAAAGLGMTRPCEMRAVNE